MKVILAFITLALLFVVQATTSNSIIDDIRTGVDRKIINQRLMELITGVKHGDTTDCKFTPKDLTFDLSSYIGKQVHGEDLSDIDRYDFELAMCGKTATCGDDPNHVSGVCMQDLNNEYFVSLGSFVKEPLPEIRLVDPENEKAGLLIVFRNGDDCHNSMDEEDMELDLTITCGKKELLSFIRTDSCVYTGEFQTPAVCFDPPASSSDSLSGGAIFLIILLVFAAIYVIGGSLYNRFVVGRGGKDIFPHITFWVSLPGLVKDGCLFVWGKLCNICGSKTITTSTGEYNDIQN